MMAGQFIFQKSGSPVPRSLLRQYSDWGLDSLDLVGPPRRLWADKNFAEPPVDVGVQISQAKPLASPSEVLASWPSGENWQAQSRRSLARLHAYFLLCEDPQRRMDAHEVDTLSHQVSLVRHILQDEKLRRVLIADEVGLGKTVEAGLIVREILSQDPNSRILYMAPARLVSNVRSEFDRLKLSFRQWSAQDADGRLTDPKLIASIHRAVTGENYKELIATPAWDVIIVDECHHLSAWEEDGGKPSRAYRLIKDLIDRQNADARVILMSGTPHQGHQIRFENLLNLLKASGEDEHGLSGRVIYRTKDDIHDWAGNPVFPSRTVREPLLIDLGVAHRAWMSNIQDFYKPPFDWKSGPARRRAAGWRCAQAMQWAASSPHAGLGYLTRQAIRANWKPIMPVLRAALAALRPYRLGPEDEDVDVLFKRIVQEVNRQQTESDVDDIEDYVPGDPREFDLQVGLESLISQGIELVETAGSEKWHIIKRELLDPAAGEKVVLFAQPIETVTALARFLESETGERPAVIIGGQDDSQRKREIDRFRRTDGPQFLISSRAGGEGINLQVARRLIHIDVPWNPMDMEQRVGRVHRFGSKETIIVDTVVVQDSREADAYRIAREKLKLITKTTVDRERFENVFGRVMCLMSQDEFQDILINAPTTPFSEDDQNRLAAMVQEGFHKWKSFHDEYGQQQQSIADQDAGLATWDDAINFLEQNAGASRKTGHFISRFRAADGKVKRVDEDADVLEFPNGRAYVCADYAEALVYGPDGAITPRLGLNLSVAADALRQVAISSSITGAAWLRWSTGAVLPEFLKRVPLGFLGFLQQQLRRDASGAWSEIGTAIYLYGVTDSDSLELCGKVKATAIRALVSATVRKNPDLEVALTARLISLERQILELLRQPSQSDLQNVVRPSVLPLFAAVVTS